MVKPWRLLAQCDGFDWDQHNADKNWVLHRVSPLECEQVFFNRPLMAKEDFEHSREELRFYALGRTNEGRLLTVIFTVRLRVIRVISARDMNRKEREIYHVREKKDPEVPE